MGAGIFWSTAVTGALVLFGVWLRDRRRDRRTLPDTLAERIEQAATTAADRHVDIWQSLNRQCQSGDNWPELRDLADRAERGLR